MNRLPEWEDRLNGWIEDCADAYFSWGQLDCLLFAAGGVLAVTGIDPGEPHRGKYRTATGATKHLLRLGYKTPADYLNDNFAGVPRSLAQRGDLVMVDGCAGICIGTDALFIGEDDGAPGLVRKPFAVWDDTTWKVG